MRSRVAASGPTRGALAGGGFCNARGQADFLEHEGAPGLVEGARAERGQLGEKPRTLVLRSLRLIVDGPEGVLPLDPASTGVFRLPDGSVLLVPDHLEEAYLARDEEALRELVKDMLGPEFRLVRLEGE